MVPPDARASPPNDRSHKEERRQKGLTGPGGYLSLYNKGCHTFLLTQSLGVVLRVPVSELCVGRYVHSCDEVDAAALLVCGQVLFRDSRGRPHKSHPVRLLLVRTVHQRTDSLKYLMDRMCFCNEDNKHLWLSMTYTQNDSFFLMFLLFFHQSYHCEIKFGLI